MSSKKWQENPQQELDHIRTIGRCELRPTEADKNTATGGNPKKNSCGTMWDRDRTTQNGCLVEGIDGGSQEADWCLGRKNTT